MAPALAGLPEPEVRFQVVMESPEYQAEGTAPQVPPVCDAGTQSTVTPPGVKHRLPATGPSLDTQFQMRKSVFCKTRSNGAW